MQKYKFEINPIKFSEILIFGKENADEIIRSIPKKKKKNNNEINNEINIDEDNNEDINANNNKPIWAYVKQLYNELTEEQQYIYIGKKNFLNKLKKERLASLNENLYYIVDDYEWYFRRGFKPIPQNAVFAQTLYDKNNDDKNEEKDDDNSEQEEYSKLLIYIFM